MCLSRFPNPSWNEKLTSMCVPIENCAFLGMETKGLVISFFYSLVVRTQQISATGRAAAARLHCYQHICVLSLGSRSATAKALNRLLPENSEPIASRPKSDFPRKNFPGKNPEQQEIGRFAPHLERTRVRASRRVGKRERRRSDEPSCCRQTATSCARQTELPNFPSVA